MEAEWASPAPSYVTLADDFVGVLKTKGNFVDHGNGAFGVDFMGGSHDTLTASVVSANRGFGVILGGSSYDTLSSDFIGTDVTGESALDLNGQSLGNTSSGVILQSGASHNTITATVVANNGQQGVFLTDTGTNYNTLTGNHVGTDLAGTYALPNQAHGVLVTAGSSFNTIGGTTTAARNVISGNAYNGIAFSSGANSNVVQGNDIGAAPSGTGSILIPNGANGVFFSGANSNTVGGTSTSAANLIAGNRANGVYVGGSTQDLIEGNQIELNSQSGVVINAGSTFNTVGGTTAAQRNLISGNSLLGVYISDAGTSKNLVEGNYIGTDASGTTNFGNGINGVDIVYGATSNTIGGTTAAARNVISGNVYNGVALAFSGTSNNLVEGNYIGTNAAGTAAVPNSLDGIQIIGGATGNIIGGTTAAARNVISGNGTYGVRLSDPGTSSNVVEGDYIGTNAAGTAAVANHFGVGIVNGASSNTVGSTADYNVISGNGWDGVQLLNAGTSYNLVQGNFVGTDPTGKLALANHGSGVAVALGATNNTVGGVVSGFRNLNVISGNLGDGVYVSDPGTSSNTIQYNFIGTDVTGESPVSNAIDGVLIQGGASYTYVYNDLISANAFAGVLVTGGNTNNNFLTSNWIGLDATGTKAVKQAGQAFSNAVGVQISGAYNTSVGYNVISGNTTGVNISGGATSNWIVYDNIGTGADGKTNVGNLQDGVILDGVAGNLVGYDLLVYNGDVGILGENGSTPSNNSLTSDTFTITIGGVTYGNKNGATDFD